MPGEFELGLSSGWAVFEDAADPTIRIDHSTRLWFATRPLLVQLGCHSRRPIGPYGISMDGTHNPNRFSAA